MDNYIWEAHQRRYQYVKDYKPAKEYPIKQRNHKLTEKVLKREQRFAAKLVCDMKGLNLSVWSERDYAHRYLACVEACMNGELVDLEKAYQDLGICVLSKKFMKD